MVTGSDATGPVDPGPPPTGRGCDCFSLGGGLSGNYCGSVAADWAAAHGCTVPGADANRNHIFVCYQGNVWLRSEICTHGCAVQTTGEDLCILDDSDPFPNLDPAFRRWMPIVSGVAAHFRLQPSLILAVMSRETGGKNELGDFGHGRGLMQVDDRTWGGWLSSHNDGMLPDSNIMKGAEILRNNLDAFNGNVRAALAAYNCGGGNVDISNPDSCTTGHNYSADVLNRQAHFRAEGVP
jgi:hypothetical protein